MGSGFKPEANLAKFLVSDSFAGYEIASSLLIEMKSDKVGRFKWLIKSDDSEIFTILFSAALDNLGA